MFEAWSVAIRIKLLDGFTTGLLGLSHQLSGANKEATALEKRLTSIKRTAAIGAGMTVAGLGILAALRPSLDEAKHFQTEVAKFQTFGLGDALNAQAIKFAKGADVIGASYTDMMRYMTEAQGVFRESGLAGPAALHGAFLAAPLLAKIHYANASLSPEEQGKRDTNAIAMLRFIEMRGGLGDPVRFNQIANSGFKAIQSSGGNVNWEQFRQFMATAGVSARYMSDKALFGQFEPLIGELKGGRAGTGLMTLYNRLEGLTRVPNQVAHELVKQNVWDGSKIEWNAQGGIKRFLGNPLRQSDLLNSSAVDFYSQVILPMYQRMHLSDGDMNREDALLGGRTGGSLFSLIRRALGTGTIAGSVASQAKAAGVEQSDRVAANTLGGKEVDLHAKLADLKEQAGESLLPIAVGFLQAIIPPLKGIADFGRAHPRLFGWLIEGVAGLGAALVLGGAFTSAVATFQALHLVLGLFRVGGAAATVASEAPVVATGLKTVGSSLFGLAGVPFGTIAKGLGSILGTAGAAAGGLGLLGLLGGADLKFMTDAKAVAEKRYGRKMSWGELFSGPGASNGVHPSVVPVAQHKPVHPHVVVKADRRGFIAWVADGLAHFSSGAQTGSSTHDPTMAMNVPGLGYHAGN